MMNVLAQAQQFSPFWSKASGSGALWGWILAIVVIGFAILFAFLQAPAQARRWIVFGFTFVSGLFYFLLWIWPAAQDRQDGDLPRNFTESGAFFLSDATSVFASLSNILTAMLLLLGVASLIRVHVLKLVKQQKDWTFSLVLLLSLGSIAFFGYWTWLSELNLTSEALERMQSPEGWTVQRKMQDLLFDGLLQAMDAAMFSIIAFYILSAAYRAFRIRSVEATILLASALIMMMSLLGIVDLYWNNAIDGITRGDNASFFNNFRLSEIALFIRQSLQSPGLRAIDFGIGIGALAMAVRLWLGLERGGGTTS